MKKRRKRSSSVSKVDHERSLEFYANNFKEFCEKCGEPLDVIKYRPKSNGHREVVAAVCRNQHYKGNGFKCELYQIEIRFIESYL